MGVTPQSSPAAGRAGAGVPEGWPPGEKLELTEDMRKVSKLKKWASLIINAQKNIKNLIRKYVYYLAQQRTIHSGITNIECCFHQKLSL